MSMTPLEELRHSCSHVLAMANAHGRKIAAAGWAMLNREDCDSLEPLKK